MLAAIFLAAASALSFGLLVSEMVEGETRAFDKTVLLAFRDPANLAEPIGPDWLASAVRDVTSLGSTTMLTLIVMASAGYLLLDGKRASTVLLLISVIGGSVLSKVMKIAFGRERPDIVPHLMTETSLSFPSGHAMNSAILYLTLGALLARAQNGRRQQAYMFGVAALVAVVVGLSRVYLGVHWPTDVLAGWSVGAAWAMGCMAAAIWFERRNG
ncbi:phosphatase PAP2 family protein [Emcibacter sp. SYSU 3D8]|uniref:phosphatase PAP2 family protein n=1 Tax=Emcibacter sp. SYSU 3D8 TaxID=3133969 RepID=UPI0031FE5132